MELDTKLKFSKIHASSQAMWVQMLEIQRCILSGTRLDSWARHLRLLYVPAVAPGMLNGRAAEDTSSALYLCEQDHLPDETNYLSVSYCWSSSTYSQRSGGYTIISDTGRRKSRAPDHVISSAVNYCQAHQIPYIWIDQECINQDQVDDKELGINSMDMVYRRSAATVGVLTSQITQQKHLSALRMLLLDEPPSAENRISNYPTSWDDEGIHQLMHSAYEILEILAADRWFTRLWTYQERAVSTQHFSVLLQYASGLNCSNAIGAIPGYVEVNLEKLAKSIAQCNRLDRRADLSKCGEHPWKDKDGEWVSIWRQYVQSRQLVLDMDLDRYSNDDNDPTVTRLTFAARILGELELRENEFVTDRLAILANMCGYTCRLDTRAVSNRGWGFSTSALTLCLLNGELPLFDLLFGYGSGETLSDYLHKCHPICGLGSVDQNLLATFRLRDVKLTPRGVQSCGWLWEITRKISLSDLKEKYRKWNRYGPTERPHDRASFPALKNAKVPVGVFMRDLWLSLRANGLEKLAMKIQQSLGDIWLNDKEPQDSMAMEIAFGAPLDPIKAIPASFSADIVPGLCESHMHLTIWMLFWQVVTHGELWAAQISGTTEELGVFTSHGTTKAFTSCENTSSGSPLGWEKYVSIEVLQDSDYPPEDGMLLGCGWLSWMNGMWYPDGAEMKNYTIPLFLDDLKKQFWEREDHFATKASLPAAATEIPW